MLKVMPGHGPHIVLFEPLENDPTLNGKMHRYDAIYGATHESPVSGGTDVTLFDGFTSSFSLRSGGSSTETIVVNRCYIGERHLDERHAAYRKYEAELSRLGEWMPITAINRKLEDGGGVHVETAEIRKSMDVPGATVDLIARGSMSFTFEEVSFKNEKSVEIGLEQPRSHDEVVGDYLIPLRNLISLATGGASRILSTRILLDEEGPWPSIVTDLTLWSQELPAEERSARFQHHLIAAPNDLGELNRMFTQWWTLVAQHRRLVNFIFGLLDDPPKYVDMRFLMLTTAVQHLSASLDDGRVETTIERLGTQLAARFGTAIQFGRRWQHIQDTFWDNSRPATAELLAVTNALEWVLRLRLLKEIGVDLEKAGTSPAFMHASSRLLQP